jgi:hypothetical protein
VDWRPQPIFVHGKHGKRGKFCRVAALTDEMVRGFVIWPIGFFDGSVESVGSTMLELALNGRDIPAQGNALGAGITLSAKPCKGAT